MPSKASELHGWAKARGGRSAAVQPPGNAAAGDFNLTLPGGRYVIRGTNVGGYEALR
jgi:hypothetical protein